MDDQVVVHVRFAPNGTVTEIGERPESRAPQEWFDALSVGAGTFYQPLSGGRAVFRLTRDKISSLQPAS